MATAEQVLAIERAYLGEGGDRFWSWYPAPKGTAWCCIFQSFCLTAAGLPTHDAWVSALFDKMRADGRNTYDIGQNTLAPGDLIAFEWGSTPGGYDHIAMVETVFADGVNAINGNVNGSKVQRLFHSFANGGIAERARPNYDTPGGIPKTKGHNLRFLLTMKNGCGVEFACAFGSVGHRWQTRPGGEWTDWTPLTSVAPPRPLDSVTARQASTGELEVIAWDATTGEAFRIWQTAPSGNWTPWVPA